MIHEFTAENGLKVIGIESHKSPVVSVQMWVRNGSADERSGEEGISHFIEHLLFKGTDHFKVGEIANMVEACGGEINAYTSYDQTVYYITISKNFFSRAMNAIYEMMACPLFDKDEIDKEREVVIEEIKRSNDSLSRRASRLLFSSLYPNYPYEIPVIGYDEVVNSVSQEHIRTFFKARYATEGMFLVVAGDFSEGELKSELKKTFALMPRGQQEKRPRPALRMIQEKLVKVEQTPFEDAVLSLSWPGVEIKHKDVAALECLGLILGQGASSRLVRKLRMEKAVVKSVGAGSWTPATQGFFSISATFNPNQFQDVLGGLKEVLETFFSQGIADEEIYKAKVNFLSDEAYSLETVGGLAQKYGGNYEATEDLFFHKKFYQDLAEVTAADVMRVAQNYLQPDKMLMACVSPEPSEKLRPALEAWTFSTQNRTQSSAKKTEVLFPVAAATASESHGLQSRIHASGGKTFFLKSTMAPVFNVRFATLGGSRVVSENKAGLVELVSRTWGAETQSQTEEQLRARLDSLASSVYSFGGKNTFGLVVDGLKQNEAELAQIFQDIVFNYKINAGILDRERMMMKESLRARKDNPAQVAILSFNKAMFQGHPYGVDSLGNNESLDSITTSDIQNYLQTYLVSQNTVSAVCGDANQDLWGNLLDQTYQHSRKQLQLKEYSIDPLNKNVWLYEHSQKEQSHIVYGFRGLTLNSPERFTLQVIEAILSGQGGRLFLELRDKASLAYSVAPIKMEGIEAGYFATYIGCSPEKADTALKMMREELMKLVHHRVPEAELQRAKNYLIGGHDIGLQRNSAIASSIAFNEVYGLSSDEVFNYASMLENITADDVQSLAKKIFSQAHVVSVVGSQEPSQGGWI